MGNYSLGMRQRLGIATALIGDPEVLILDEPANGLDPAGIRWMRDLLRGYADRGGTVLLSSHLLHEIEVIADDIVVIGHGRIVSQGTKTELLHAAGTMVRAVRPGPARTGPDRLADSPRRRTGDGALRTDADAALVGTVALDGRVSPSPNCGPPRAPAWRKCSSSSPPTPNAKEHRMTAIAAEAVRARQRAVVRPAPHPAAASSPSSSASCSTPDPVSG